MEGRNLENKWRYLGNRKRNVLVTFREGMCKQIPLQHPETFKERNYV